MLIGTERRRKKSCPGEIIKKKKIERKVCNMRWTIEYIDDIDVDFYTFYLVEAKKNTMSSNTNIL